MFNTRSILFTLCFLPACAVPTARVWNPDSIAAFPMDQEREQQRRDRAARREAERRARNARRDAERRARADRRRSRVDRDQDPDWPQGRRRDDEQDRDRDRDNRRDDRPRQSHTYLIGTLGGGDYDLKDSLGTEDNGADVIRVRAGSENASRRGAGIDVTHYDARRHAHAFLTNSLEFDQLDVHMFVSKRIGKETARFNSALRFGPYYDRIQTEQNLSGKITDYHSVGFRIEAEPTITFARRNNMLFQAYTTISLGAHLSFIDDEVTNRNYDSKGTTLGVEPGIRLVVDHLILNASYQVSETSIRKSQTERGVRLSRVETEFQGFLFSVGLRF